MRRLWRSWRRSWRTGTEQVEWYLLPLRTRIQISRSIRRGEAAPREHRAIALKEAERALWDYRIESLIRVIAFPLLVAWMAWFIWSNPESVAFIWSVLETRGSTLNWILLAGLSLLQILRTWGGKKRLMRAIELNRDHPDDPATVALPFDAAEQ